MPVFTKTPCHFEAKSIETRIHLRISGFSFQRIVPIEDIVHSIDTLPSQHLQGLKEIVYAPEERLARPVTSPLDLAHRRIKAEFIPYQRRIVVYDFDNSAMFFQVLFHEIGHFVYFLIIESYTKKKWVTDIYPGSSCITRYGEFNACEDFSETYALFLRDPEMLQRLLPVKYTFMLDNVFNTYR